MAKRRTALKLDREITKTNNGYIRTPAYLTRCGVLTYVRADGKIVRELRHPEDVFAQDSLDTLKSIALTNTHPKDKLLTPENTKNNIVGWIGDEVQPVDIYLQSDVTIFDDKSIQEVEDGEKEELSCGYNCDLEESPGTWMGQAYDVRQRNIRYNHVSLVKKGRAGDSVRLHLDADDAELVEDQPNPLPEEVMKEVTINGQTYQVPEAVAAHLAGLESTGKQEMDSLKQQLDAANEKLKGTVPAAEKAAVEQQNQELQAKNDSLEAQIKAKNDSADPVKMQEAVKARVKLEKVGVLCLKDATKLDAMSDMEIKKAVIAAKEPSAKLDDKSETYVNARFDSVCERMEDEINAFSSFTTKVITRNDGQGDEIPDSAKARQKMVEDGLNAWKQK